MEFGLVKLLSTLILPPGGLLVLALTGLVLLRSKVRGGKTLLAVSLALLYLLSMPVLSGALMRGLESYPALSGSDINNSGADAIVVLAGGRLQDQPEFGGDTVSPISLQRLRYAAWLKRRTQLPLYISGGREPKSEAELMQEVVQKEFNVQVDMVETKSKTTYENAKFTAALLKQQGYHKILLVSSAFHMPRAVEAFHQFAIEVIAAPTVFTPSQNGLALMDILPQAYGIQQSYYALHEWFGILWYKVRYY